MSTTKEEDSRLLFQLLSRRTEDAEVRRGAYEALLLLHGRTDIPPVNKPLDLDRDADWAWLRALVS